jgi:outer membrane receptor protein involved in Fe transport
MACAGRSSQSRSARAAALCTGALLAVLPFAGLPAHAQPAPADAAAPAEEEAGGSAADPTPAAPEPALDAAEPASPRRPALPPGLEVMTIYSSGIEDMHLDEAVSMTAFTADELKSLRIANLEDLADFTPNLQINTRSAASNPTLFIRGIGLKDYNANAAGAVSIYQDGININAPAIQLLQLFDVGEVEIRRGPQGSAEGRNATAGAIFIHSQPPTDTYEMGTSFSLGNYDSLTAEGFVNLPILEDTLAARVAFVANMREGTVKNGCANWDPRVFPQFADQGPAQTRQGRALSYIVTPETLRAEYFKDKAANNAPNNVRYRITDTDNQNRQTRINQAGTGDQAVQLELDNACILQTPGTIITARGELQGLGPEGTFDPERVPQLADFQGLDRRTGDIDNWASRAILSWRPRDDMSWMLNFHNFRDSGDYSSLSMVGADARDEVLGFDAAIEEGFSEANIASELGLEGTERAPGVIATPNFEALRGDDPFIGYFNQDGSQSIKQIGSSLKGTWDYEDLHFTSLTGYEDYRRFVEDEGDANPLSIFPAAYKDSAYQISQELRVTGERGPVDWTAGGFFLYEYLKVHNLFPDTSQFEVRQLINQKLISFAPYVAGVYTITEEVGLEAGARYNVEHKDFQLSATSRGTSSAVEVPEIGKQQVTRTWTAPTGEVKLTYAPSWALWLDWAPVEQLNSYVKYAHGFKGGHFNGSQTIRNDVREKTKVVYTRPEYIHAAELGVKTSLFRDRLVVTAAGFRYWYSDLQVFDIRNEAGELPTQQLLNGDARVWGAEVEVDLRPFQSHWLEGLRIQGNYAYLDSKFTNFEVLKTTVAGRGGTQDTTTLFGYGGNPLIASPRYSMGTIIEYEIPLFGWGHLVPHWDLSWRSKIYLDPQKIDPISQPAYWLHNASISYRTEEGQLEVSAWMDNVFDEHYKDDAFDLTREFNTILESYNDPRMFGVTVTLTW